MLHLSGADGFDSAELFITSRDLSCSLIDLIVGRALLEGGPCTSKAVFAFLTGFFAACNDLATTGDYKFLMSCSSESSFKAAACSVNM